MKNYEKSSNLKNKVVRYFFPIMSLFCLLGVGQLYAGDKSTGLYQQAASKAYAGAFDEAIVLFKKSIAMSPYYARAHYGLGKVYLYKKGSVSNAIYELQLATRLDRSMAKAHFYLGMAYMLDKKYRRAVKSFYRSFELDRSYIEALYNMSMVYDLVGDNYESEYYYQKYYNEKTREQAVF